MYKATAIVASALLVCSITVFAADTTKMIIFPLYANVTEEELGWLNEGISISLGEQLESRNLKVIGRSERIQLVENLDLPPGGRLSRGSMIRVAQQAAANLLVMGEFSGTDRNLKIVLRVLDLRSLKLSGEITANGPISAMPQMENELAWLVLSNVGIEKAETRAEFQRRMRKVPNSAYSYFIQSFSSSNASAQIQLLKKAIGAYQNFPEAQFQLGKLYFSKKDCENAQQHLALGWIEGRTDSEDSFMRGTCYAMKGQPMEAIQSLSQVMSYSRSLEVLNNIGVAYLRNGDNALALNALLEAKNLSHADSTVSMNLAIAHLLKGSDLAARIVVEEAVKSHPRNGMLQFILSYFLNKQGETEKTAVAASKAKSLGVDVDKLRLENPTTWSRLIFNWEH